MLRPGRDALNRFVAVLACYPRVGTSYLEWPCDFCRVQHDLYLVTDFRVRVSRTIGSVPSMELQVVIVIMGNR